MLPQHFQTFYYVNKESIQKKNVKNNKQKNTTTAKTVVELNLQ